MRKLFTFLALILIDISLFAQAPEKMSYQAVIRDANDDLVTSTSIGMQISILKGSSETPVYVERQFPTTNVNGLVSIEIGGAEATVVSGTFTSIDWSLDTYFIKTETDIAGGSNYTITGMSQLLSVPYALHARTAENTIENDPVFDASVASAITESDTTNWNNKLNTEVDGSITNELQTLSLSNDTIYLTDGSYVKIPEKYWTYSNNVITYPEGVHIGSTSSQIATALYVEGSTDVSGSTTMILKRSNTRHNMISFQNLDNTQMSSIGLLAYSPRLSLTTYKSGTWYNSFQIELGTPENTLYLDELGNVGIGTGSPSSKLEIANGDVYLPNSSNGIILTSPDGQCWRVTIDNSGNLQTTSITCP